MSTLPAPSTTEPLRRLPYAVVRNALATGRRDAFRARSETNRCRRLHDASRCRTQAQCARDRWTICCASSAQLASRLHTKRVLDEERSTKSARARTSRAATAIDRRRLTLAHSSERSQCLPSARAATTARRRRRGGGATRRRRLRLEKRRRPRPRSTALASARSSFGSSGVARRVRDLSRPRDDAVAATPSRRRRRGGVRASRVWTRRDAGVAEPDARRPQATTRTTTSRRTATRPRAASCRPTSTGSTRGPTVPAAAPKSFRRSAAAAAAACPRRGRGAAATRLLGCRCHGNFAPGTLRELTDLVKNEHVRVPSGDASVGPSRGRRVPALQNYRKRSSSSSGAVSAEYPRGSRGVAATRPRTIHA